jgi:hypothetical protein
MVEAIMINYSDSHRVPRPNDEDAREPILAADESLIVDPRGNPRPNEVINQRMDRLFGTRLMPLGETWTSHTRVLPGAIALKMVGD